MFFSRSTMAASCATRTFAGSAASCWSRNRGSRNCETTWVRSLLKSHWKNFAPDSARGGLESRHYCSTREFCAGWETFTPTKVCFAHEFIRRSSISDYVDSDGNRGEFQLRHRVYQRDGKPCVRCRVKIRRMIVAGRSSHFCPRCQPAPRQRKPRQVGKKTANARGRKSARSTGAG